jgi:hypothetical protein
MDMITRRATAVALVVWLIAFPGFLAAQGRRGASVLVTLKDGSQVGGELIAVKPDSLLLLSYVGRDQAVPLADIESVAMKVNRKGKGGSGFLAGALIGGIAGGLFAANQIKNEETEFPGLTAVLSPLIAGSLGGLIGMAIGSAGRSSRETILIAGVSAEELANALARLRKIARVTGLP